MSDSNGITKGPSASLCIYIEPTLLDKDNAGQNRLSNLTFSRVVDGVSNTVYKSVLSNDLTEGNELSWSDAYAIAAAKTTPHDGTPVRKSTGPVVIAIGQSADWLDAHGRPVQSFPGPKDDADFKEAFGTKNQGPEWYNSLWAKDKDNKTRPIYQDTQNYTRLAQRKYHVQKSYQLSWEEVNYVEGTFVSEWSRPHMVFPKDDQATYYISWGTANGKGEPEWFHYGTEDPHKHDPTKAISDTSAAAVSTLEVGGEWEKTAYVKLDWTEAIDPLDQEKYNLLLSEFLGLRKTSGVLEFSEVKTPWDYRSLSFSAKLKPTWTAKYLAGRSDKEKTIHHLRGLLAILPVQIAPNAVDFNALPFHTQTDEL